MAFTSCNGEGVGGVVLDRGDNTIVCSVVEITLTAMEESLRSRDARSGPVMNCVYGAAIGLKASVKAIECVDAAP
jgi:hypothetical protein